MYDNLFWGKTFKDLSQIAVRAVGWNLGSLREIPGGVSDLGRMFGDGAQGKRPTLTGRTAYVIGLPVIVGLVGAIATYLMTGEGPREPMDYFYPRTGKKNPDGDNERISLPSYIKDIVSYQMHQLGTVLHKLAPLWDMIAAMLENKDFFGDKIRNEDDPFVQRRLQEAEYVWHTVQPLGIQNLREATKREQSTGVKVAGFFGMTEAPREVTRTPAENKIMEYIGAKMPRGATPEEADLRRERGELKTQMRTDPAGAGAKADSLLRSGALTLGQRQSFDRTAHTDPWLSRFGQLTFEQAAHVYALATPPERLKFKPLIGRKVKSAADAKAYGALR